MEFGEVWNNWALDNLKKMSLALSDQKNQRFFGTTSPCAAVQKMGKEINSKVLAEQSVMSPAVHIVVLGQV